MRQPTAIIFDLDGTLIDSAADIHQALNSVLQKNALPGLELQAVQLMIGGGPRVLISKALDALGVVTASDEIDRLSQEFQHTYLERGNKLTVLFPGAVDCLQHLAEQKIRIGLCSNKPENICQQSLSDLGIRHFFDAVQGSGSGLPLKPHPAALYAALRCLETVPDRALYVGDSETDVTTARNAGVSVALVRSGYTMTPADALGADWVVDRLAEIPSIWRQRHAS